METIGFGLVILVGMLIMFIGYYVSNYQKGDVKHAIQKTIDWFKDSNFFGTEGK